jgi:Heterokaryon incompatibility protein (HET)
MPQNIPKALTSPSRSSFALIDPTTERYERVLDRHGSLRGGLKMHTAISYVWSEWKDSALDGLPSWPRIRERLMSVLGPGTPRALRSQTWNASCCWLDCKCINQDSDEDKAYWVPRMDEVYSEAECTLLLLRYQDLTALMEIAQEMKCKFEGQVPFAERMLAPHSCLLSQSCTTLPELTVEWEIQSLEALKSLASGIWRKRAWIFQEILLSRNYLLSWSGSGWMSLASVGVIAAIFSKKHRAEAWLDEFATWCRRLEYLRQYYDRSQSSDLSDANVLQMTSELEATVPGDKYYALCGILRLKSVQYNSSHTADEALHAIIQELTRCGRLSWLYAVPPSLENPGIQLASNNMAPFVLTRLHCGLIAKRRSIHLAGSTISFDAIHIGTVISVQPLNEVLQETRTILQERDFNFQYIIKHSSEREVENLRKIPAIVLRLALEVVAPLLLEPVFGHICKVLQIENDLDQPIKEWGLVMLLCFLDIEKHFKEHPGFENDNTAIAVVTSSALSVRRHLEKVQYCFALVKWETSEVSRQSTHALQHVVGLGFLECNTGSSIYCLRADEELLLAADSNQNREGETVLSAFRGMIFQLKVRETIGNVPSSLFGPFWKSWKTGKKSQLTFSIGKMQISDR